MSLPRSQIVPPHIASPADLGLVPGSRSQRPMKTRNYLRSIDGHSGGPKILGDDVFHSILELDHRKLLFADPNVVEISIESHTLRYYMPSDVYPTNLRHNKRAIIDGISLSAHRYTPDVVTRYRNGRLRVYDAKASFFRYSERWTLCEPYIKNAYANDHGIEFITISEDEIRQQPRLKNIEILLRHRYVSVDAEALLLMKAVVASGPPQTTIASLLSAVTLENRPGQDRAYSAIANMALAGDIDIDMTSPLSPSSRIIRSIR